MLNICRFVNNCKQRERREREREGKTDTTKLS